MGKIRVLIFLLLGLTIYAENNRLPVDISGYAEARTFLPWQNSVNFNGFGRGWLEFKTNHDYYGAQTAFDYFVPFDTIHTFSIKPGLNISRLAVWLGPENIRITLGKQRIIWGVARIFRPLDIFNPTNFLEPGYERFGINAIHFNLALGSLTDIRLLCLPQFDLKNSASACRFGSNLFKNDIGLNVYYKTSEKKYIIGADLAGELLIGYWAEFTYNKEDTAKYLKTSVGIDYTFPLTIYGMVEYFYDQSGEANPQHYDFTKLLTGTRSTLARQYLFVSFSSIPNLILSPSINSIINLNDRSFILIPQISYQPWDNTQLNFGFYFPIGSAPSEFKNLNGFNGIGFLWAKVYF